LQTRQTETRIGWNSSDCDIKQKGNEEAVVFLNAHGFASKEKNMMRGPREEGEMVRTEEKQTCWFDSANSSNSCFRPHHRAALATSCVWTNINPTGITLFLPNSRIESNLLEWIPFHSGLCTSHPSQPVDNFPFLSCFICFFALFNFVFLHHYWISFSTSPIQFDSIWVDPIRFVFVFCYFEHLQSAPQVQGPLLPHEHPPAFFPPQQEEDAANAVSAQPLHSGQLQFVPQIQAELLEQPQRKYFV